MRYTRSGGFRSAIVARLTRGRLGLGRWTRAEVEGIRARASRTAAELRRYVD